MIDPELRASFLEEVTELQEHIEDLVLQLERGENRDQALAGLGRCFHTLKGTAGSVGLTRLASEIHLLEDHLRECGESDSDHLFDRLRAALSLLEATRKNLAEPPSPPTGHAIAAPVKPPAGPPAPTPATTESENTPSSFAEEPIRVGIAQLETLMDSGRRADHPVAVPSRRNPAA